MTACISRMFICNNLRDADHHSWIEREPSWAPHPELDASVNSVTSVSWMTRGRPCRTADDAHQTTSCRTHWGTVILSVQFPVLCHQAVVTHHWIGQSLNLPRCTSWRCHEYHHAQHYLCRSLAVMMGLLIQCWWTDWTHFRQGCHCKPSSVETHSQKLEVLAWC